MINLLADSFLPGCRYAVVVFTNVHLQNNTVNGEQSLVSITVFYAPVELSVDPGTAFTRFVLRTEVQQNVGGSKHNLLSLGVFNLCEAITIGIASGTTVGIFIILLLVLIGFIIYWRRLVTAALDEYDGC